MEEKLTITHNILDSINFVKPFVAKHETKKAWNILKNILIDAREDFIYVVGCDSEKMAVVRLKNLQGVTGQFLISPNELSNISILSNINKFKVNNEDTYKYPEWKNNVYDAFKDKNTKVEFKIDMAVIDFLKNIKSSANITIGFRFNENGAYLTEISSFLKLKCNCPILFTDIYDEYVYYNFKLPRKTNFKIYLKLNHFITATEAFRKDRIDFYISILDNNVIKIRNTGNSEKLYISFIMPLLD